MLRLLTISALLILVAPRGFAEPPENVAAESERASETNGDGIDRPKAMSGMSILGNEEAPKSLVIIPWKSSDSVTTSTLAIHSTIARNRSTRKYSSVN